MSEQSTQVVLPDPQVAYQNLFEGVYQRTRELGIRDPAPFFSDVYELADGTVQMYVRDPAGNLVELDYPYADRIDRSVRLSPCRMLGSSSTT